MQNIHPISMTGQQTVIQPEQIENLRASIRGQLLLKNDTEFDKIRRVWNAMIDKRPAMIVRCLGVTDVVEAVKFALLVFSLPTGFVHQALCRAPAATVIEH